MEIITTSGQPISLLQKHHLTQEIQQMYKAVGHIRDVITPEDEKEWKLTAAGYADGVVIRVRECAKTEGNKLIRLLNGSSVTLAKAEQDAYAWLSERAKIAPENKFTDCYGKDGRPIRWFPWDANNIRIVPAQFSAQVQGNLL